MAQLCFDFDAPAKKAKRQRKPIDSALAEAKWNAEYWAQQDAEARAYWRVGMVAALPCMAEIEGIGDRYSMMLPCVIEAINGDTAHARIYAAPEWGYTLEDYPLHLQLAVNVPLRGLGKYHSHSGLQAIVDAGLLAVGCAKLGERVRAGVKAARALADSIK